MLDEPFHYQAPFLPKEDDTEYYLLTSEHISASGSEGQEILEATPEVLAPLARQASYDASPMLRPAHQQQVADILRGLETNGNGEHVALQFLCNSDIAAEGVPPTCQDTDTVIIVGKKGQYVWTGGGDEAALARGVYNTYIRDNLRYSQSVPLDMYKEVNTGTNLPMQIDLYAVDGGEYRFLCIAKGGGSANETYLYQETKALPAPGKLKSYLVERMHALDTTACPLYHIAFVIGGASVEMNLKTVELVSAKYYDELPVEGNGHSRAFRDMELEKELLIGAQNLSLGAQFDGKYFAHDIRVIRLPRYDASCPVDMGVSCFADRDIKARINRQGVWIEKLEHNPSKYIPEELRKTGGGKAVRIGLNRSIREILIQLSQCPVSTRLSLNGTIIAGRDIAHARLKKRMDNDEGLPQYIKDRPIYYAGPARTSEGYASGSLGPTTVERTDPHVNQLQAQGGSMIILARGNRSQQVVDAYKKHGDFYLGSIGGPAAVLVQGSIESLKCIEYPELGVEIIWKIEVEDFPAFILVDGKGNDLFQQIQLTQCTHCVK